MADRKKTFADQLENDVFNPAMQFISTPAPRGQQPRPQKPAPRTPAAPAKEETAEQPAPPTGYRMNPMYIENKTRRLQLLLKPSTYEAVRDMAEREGVSVNALINDILETAAKG